MKATRNLTEGNIYLNLLLYSVPLILSSFLSQAYSTVDSVIAGKCISEYALGAISATSSFEIVFTSLVRGIAGGFSIYIAQLFGKGEFTTIKRDVIGMTAFVTLLAAGFSLFSIAFRVPIMDFLNVDPILRSDAITYFTVYQSGLVIFYVNDLLIAVLHALGITSFSFYVSLLSAILNIAGNLLTVIVFGMGVAGLALSTLFSALAATAVYLIVLRRAFSELPSDPIPRRPDFSSVKSSLRYTLPHALQLLSFHGVTLLIAPAINILGAEATTGYSIANRIYSLGTISLWAYASAFGCYTGQCVGKRDTQKIRRGVRVGFLMCCAVLFPFVIAILLFAKPFSALFFPNGYTGEALDHAVRYAMVFFPLVYVQLIGHFFHTYLRSLGRVSVVLWITLIGSTVRVAGALTLIPWLGLDGTFIAQVLSWAVDAMICSAIYFRRYRTDKQLLRVIET